MLGSIQNFLWAFLINFLVQKGGLIGEEGFIKRGAKREFTEASRIKLAGNMKTTNNEKTFPYYKNWYFPIH